MSARRLLTVGVTTILAGVLLVPGALASPALIDVEGDIELDDSNAAVTLDYTVTSGEETVETVPLTALHFGDASFTAIEAVTDDGQPLDVGVEEGPPKTTIEITPPAPLEPGQELGFTLSYQAVDAVTARGEETDVVEVPVFAVAWPPAENRSGVFTGTLALPEGERFSEGFPSTPATTQEGGRQVLTYDMIVMPALIRAVATSGTPPFLTYQRTLELLAVVVVLALSAALYYWTVHVPRRRSTPAGDVHEQVPA